MFLDRIVNSLEKSFVNASRTRARLNLLTRSERVLADGGFSRDLLEQGNQAWPWRIDGNVPTSSTPYIHAPAGLRTSVPAMQQNYASNAKAVADLNADSDVELADLGIARTGIVEAVHFGRSGSDKAVNRSDDRQAA